MDTQSLPQKLQNEKWGFWGTLIWSAVVLAFVLGGQLVARQVIYSDISKKLINISIRDSTAFHLFHFLILLIVVLTLYGIIRLKKNSNIKNYLAINKINFKQIITWSLIAITILIVQYLLYYFRGIPYINQDFVKLYNSNQPWLLFFTGVICVPLSEELFYRGFLFSGFASSFLRPVGAIIVTSLLFAVGHFSGDLFLVFFMIIPGLAVGTARLKTNSLLTPIIMHSLVNLVEVIKIAIYAS